VIDAAESRELSDALTSALEIATSSNGRFLGLGVDAVNVARFRSDRLLRGPGYLSDTFTESEAEYCNTREDPDGGYAGTFAAKEAVCKAARLEQDGSFSWRWIEILQGHGIRSRAIFSSELVSRSPRINDGVIEISIMEAGDYAIAVALILEL